ncbi:MAG: phosphate ABC transporter ATP-binding protein [Lentimicrobium sp.]|uniref:phosphate ABC transporter ATP-binding protein n=1 Tax=Lentimicrobium sp. TaxID=2034841 RepID=UPI0025D9D2FA|nr:phosphate ABC transporter ATP-binding protein [Lentimicrobium sp.]MCO5255536.1 phosphate ABC transporter ATP-binding protein [Lentimicrobium sp.]MCO5261765.1 phosphate ABC transporter ATP-binding protein [Lentimicrobium sp.]HPF63945.1 phosphate ABC transporter ATP-binding protein [Lentimicrobium sp.]
MGKPYISTNSIEQLRILRATEPEAVLRVKNLNVKAGDHHILKNINLEIPKNRITVLLGPSGCGKTTLLKCLNKLTDLYRELKVSGNIYIDNDDILNTTASIPDIRQKMGLLSQRPYPLPISIYKNVAYGLKLKGVRDKKLIAFSVEKHLREVGLWEEVKNRLNSPASSLSIGQQQRLCLARGLAVKPSIILADEPTSALDPTSSKIIENLFRDIKKHYTIILVTHVLRQAIRLADHVIFMDDGEIIEEGSPVELFENARTDKLRAYLVDGN